MKIITNNPKFKNFNYTDFYDTDYMGILVMARDLIHNNYSLLTHPLYGSVKPNETVYRTIVLTKKDTLDYSSLQLIEDAIVTCDTFQKKSYKRHWPDEILEDFQVVDYDLITQSLQRINTK